MAIERTIVCDVCGAAEKEPERDSGFVGWGAVQGVALNEMPNPTVCPLCMRAVMQALERIVAINKGE
jgi:hypothetical protein